MTFTTDTAKTALEYWQKRLRLQDWDLTLEIVRKSKITTGEFAEVEWSRIYRNAEIKLLDPVDFEEADTARQKDMEDSLVHELLHLVLRDCRINSRDDKDKLTAQGIAEERAIDALSCALVSLHREGKP